MIESTLQPAVVPAPASRGVRRSVSRGIVLLAVLALAAQSADLVSAVRMIARYGTSAELNPVARALVERGGVLTLSGIKLAAAACGIVLFVYVGNIGRTRVAAAALCVATIVGALGYVSNLV